MAVEIERPVIATDRELKIKIVSGPEPSECEIFVGEADEPSLTIADSRAFAALVRAFQAQMDGRHSPKRSRKKATPRRSAPVETIDADSDSSPAADAQDGQGEP